jgi:hypothetical protein
MFSKTIRSNYLGKTTGVAVKEPGKNTGKKRAKIPFLTIRIRVNIVITILIK